MVASELASAADLGAQRVDDACTHVGHDHDEQVGEHEREKKLQRAGLNEMGKAVISNQMTTGTELTEASAAITARRGGVGMTTVNNSVHTATQESPNQRTSGLNPAGSRNSAAAMP